MGESEREIQLKFQVRWILGFSAVSILSSVIFLFLLKKVLSQELSSSYSQAFYTLKNFQKLLFPAIGFSVLFYVLLVSALVALITIFISHSIAGPLFRLERFAECLRRGELNYSTRLRQGDQLGGMAKALGELREVLVEQLRPIGLGLERIEEHWQKLDAAAPSEFAGLTDEFLSRIEAELKKPGAF